MRLPQAACSNAVSSEMVLVYLQKKKPNKQTTSLREEAISEKNILEKTTRFMTRVRSCFSSRPCCSRVRCALLPALAQTWDSSWCWFWGASASFEGRWLQITRLCTSVPCSCHLYLWFPWQPGHSSLQAGRRNRLVWFRGEISGCGHRAAFPTRLIRCFQGSQAPMQAVQNP